VTKTAARTTTAIVSARYHEGLRLRPACRFQ